MNKLEQSMKVISVIVPVYNVREYLSKCIDSLINQKYPAVEIILIDDGSTDGSDKILDEYSDKDVRIKVIHIPNGGVSNARNIGLDMATGDYITFVDSDDWIEPDFFELGIQKLQSNEADIFIGEYVEVYDGGRSKIADKRRQESLFYVDEAIKCTFIRGKGREALPWGVWGKIYRMQLLNNIRFDTELTMGEDVRMLWDIMQRAEKVIYTPTVIYDYYQRSDSAVHTLSIKQNLNHLKFYKLMIHECENEPQILTYFQKRLDAVRVLTIIYSSRNGEYCDELGDEKNIFRTHLWRHICSEWELQGCRGLVKICVACMPDFVIRSIMKMKSYLKID